MKIFLSSRDSQFSSRVRTAFAREGGVVRTDDRTAIWDRLPPDENCMLLHVRNASSGVRWCRVTRRAQRQVPLIVCCDDLEPDDLAPILNAGADDVVRASVAPTELMARVRAVCRRTSSLTGGGHLQCGPVVLDISASQASVLGTAIPLRPAEFRLFSYLATNRERVIGARELMTDLIGNTNPDTTLIRVHLSQLRRKLGAVGVVIETVRGVGYRLGSGA